MSARTRLKVEGLIGTVLASVVAGCSNPGDLSITNGGQEDVVVRTGDEDVAVSASGGAVVLGYGCTPGDVTVQFASGRSTVLPGPVCPDQQIIIGDETASLWPADAPGTWSPTRPGARALPAA